ncbi:MAG: tRNA guanosine(34) transglycosylase Tgt [Deltaproteobacteria bacterium]|nr:tRNA guanosine(34) transglycosylase Tgt [Deltaproteobacteria bacterium]
MTGHFEIRARDLEGRSQARTGILRTLHGEVETPAFMPVGTRGSVKGVGPDDLERLGAEIILCNAFHLMLRPGAEVVNSLGGIHRFTGWKGPVLTDSGGFQIYSLKSLRKIGRDGAVFKSPYDGASFFISPEKAVEAQSLLGVDVMMCLDECPPYPETEEGAKRSMDLTLEWAERSKKAWDPSTGGLLFGISQGSFHPELRLRSALDLKSLDLPGYAAGGLALGEPRSLRLEAVESSFSGLPEDRPRYLMGVGTPGDILDGVRLGADLFDCVIPTRNARNGQLFTKTGRLNIQNSRHRKDPLPPEEGCGCLACQNFSRAYLAHLHRNREPLFSRLASIHNLHFYFQLMRGCRKSLKEGTFMEYYREFFDTYEADRAGKEDPSP